MNDLKTFHCCFCVLMFIFNRENLVQWGCQDYQEEGSFKCLCYLKPNSDNSSFYYSASARITCVFEQFLVCILLLLHSVWSFLTRGLFVPVLRYKLSHLRAAPQSFKRNLLTCLQIKGTQNRVSCP